MFRSEITVLAYYIVQFLNLPLYFYTVTQTVTSCAANAVLLGQATWAIWAAIKEYSLTISLNWPLSTWLSGHKHPHLSHELPDMFTDMRTYRSQQQSLYMDVSENQISVHAAHL